MSSLCNDLSVHTVVANDRHHGPYAKIRSLTDDIVLLGKASREAYWELLPRGFSRTLRQLMLALVLGLAFVLSQLRIEKRQTPMHGSTCIADKGTAVSFVFKHT